MRASELLRRPVRTASGRSLGVVHDLRLRRRDDGLAVTGLVVGADTLRLRAAHVTGIAQGRTTGPAAATALLSPRPEPLLVDAREVLTWTDREAIVVGDHLAANRSGGSR